MIKLKIKRLWTVERVELLSDQVLYIMLRDHWCEIIVLNVYAPTRDKIDDVNEKL
jgi:hypothetical protein